MSDIKLSVVVCTLDRASLLEGCLEALIAERPNDGSVEIIVVDNGSSDRTPAVVAACPAVAHIVEPERGLAHARNTGLEVSSAELVAFVDDDARPEPGWAAGVLAARSRWPSGAALGGPVLLEWGGARPSWVVPDLHRWFSAIDHGPVARLLGPDEALVGANMAVARDQALAVGAFAPELGRMGASLLSGEEVDLLRRLREAGGEIGWEPAAAVRHLVLPERMTRRWLLRRAWAQGRTDSAAARLGGGAVPRGARPALRALARGWPTAAREIRAADSPSGAAMREMTRRARRLAQALG